MLSFILLTMLGVGSALGLERGAILYHSSKGNDIYGRLPQLILPESIGQIAFREMKSGHVGLYIGTTNGNHRIIHAVMPIVEETDSNNFIPQEDLDTGCQYIGAKVPVNFSDTTAWPVEMKDQLILLAKEQVGAKYDFQFLHQKGPYADGFTCVGLIEYLFENVGYDITPNGYYKDGIGGFTYTQIYNSELTLWRDWSGLNTFSSSVEYSKFEHPVANILNMGTLHDGDRYMFFHYTQYVQASTMAVTTDIPVSGGSGTIILDSGVGGCFIATAAYGSYLHPHVRTFSILRDRYLLMSTPGRTFVKMYYQYSPSIADFISRHDGLKAAARIALLPLLGLSILILWGGPLPTAAMTALFLLLPVFLLLRKRMKRQEI